MIKVIDNVVGKKEQEKIKNILLGMNFDWYYLNDITSKDSLVERKPGVSHQFYARNRTPVHSRQLKHIMNLLTTTARKLKIKQFNLLLSRAFLQFPLSNYLLKNSYVDDPHIDMPERHLVFLYYVNDSDGDTRFWSNTDNVPNLHKEPIFRYTPKKGTGVLFPSETWHCSSNPISSDYRMVINYIFQPV